MSIKEDNLLPFEGTVKAGQRLMKVGDMWMTVGVGGNFEPGKVSFTEIGRGSYYKCETVDETTKTWTGYELVLDGVYYTVSETLTEGLIYGTGYTPKVGKIYNHDATMIIDKYNKESAIPTDGLIFYAPFDGSTAPEVGRLTSVKEGNNPSITYSYANGVPYATFFATILTVETTEEVSSDASVDMTWLVIGRASSVADSGERSMATFGGTFSFMRLYSKLNSGTYTYMTSGSHVITDVDRNFHCFIYRRKGGVREWIMDGVSYTHGSGNECSGSVVQLGGTTYTPSYGRCDLADCAVWNRALTDEEVASLVARAASMNG